MNACLVSVNGSVVSLMEVLAGFFLADVKCSATFFQNCNDGRFLFYALNTELCICSVLAPVL